MMVMIIGNGTVELLRLFIDLPTVSRWPAVDLRRLTRCGSLIDNGVTASTMVTIICGKCVYVYESKLEVASERELFCLLLLLLLLLTVSSGCQGNLSAFNSSWSPSWGSEAHARSRRGSLSPQSPVYGKN